jgi:hypothetical protein
MDFKKNKVWIISRKSFDKYADFNMKGYNYQ